ncbi:MAG: hypothetical protein PHO27_02780 [Sulfuricurvum sp.]|nr:hypothetical protein [Sulfuricurvum sp.]
MKSKFSLFTSIFLISAYTAQASDQSTRDDLISVYGTHSSYDISNNSSNSYGLAYDTEKLKLSIAGASGLFATSALYKFDPMRDRQWFVKVGGNYTHQDFSTVKLTALGATLATGYMVQDDIYVEAGGSITKHDDTTNLANERIKIASTHAVKRFETSMGTVDTAIGFNRIYRNISDENFYIGTLNYYPVDNARLGFGYAYSNNSISNNFTVDYGYLHTNHTRNLTTDMTTTTIGVQFAFSDITDFASYKMPTNIKRHISE